MIAHLQALRNSIWIKIVVLIFACGVTGTSAYYVLRLTNMERPFAFLIVGSVVFVVGIVVAKMIASNAVNATDYLSKAILVATGTSKDIDIPNDAALDRPSKDFLTGLVRDLSFAQTNGSAQSQQSTAQLAFYSTGLAAMPLPAIIVDKDQVIRFANEAACKYLERPMNDVVGNLFYDVCNLSFTSDQTLENWLQSCREGAVVENETWNRVRLNISDTNRKQFDLAAHYRKDDETGIELILVFNDQTHHYDKDDHDLSFISLAVHELRTPLTIMRGYIEVFEDELGEGLNSEQKEFMYNMSACAQQLTSFASNILNVARIEENELYLQLKEDTWEDVLRAACKDMQLRAAVQDKQIVIEIEGEPLPAVAVDKVSIYEVMNNLLDNAIKYTHTKETILIKTYLKNGMIETSVSDKGVGIAENLIPHIFDKFYRAHKSKNSVGGTGLGLYLCKSIIDAHGGSIWVNSIEGVGTTIGFTLPIYSNIADQLRNNDNKEIVRSAHGWIKNHSLYRG